MLPCICDGVMVNKDYQSVGSAIPCAILPGCILVDTWPAALYLHPKILKKQIPRIYNITRKTGSEFKEEWSVSSHSTLFWSKRRVE